MNWQPHAAALATRVTHHTSRWRGPVASVPRHQFVPNWWQRTPAGWALQRGADDTRTWLAVGYRDISLITRVGPLHADHAKPDDQPQGMPTSSATLPSLLVRMFQHARLDDCDELLDVGTGSGYGTALVAQRLGNHRVTSVDVDPYLVDAARRRLERLQLRPHVVLADATDELPGGYDRIVATVGVRPIPASWLAALKPSGRLVTTIGGTSLIVTADKRGDGSAVGRVEWDRAGFMRTREGEDFLPRSDALVDMARTAEGEEIHTGPYPVIDTEQAWDLASMLEITVPGILHGYEEMGERHTTWLAHEDGSWARATALGSERPTVHQSGPRRLWDTLDEIRAYWLQHGELPLRGANVLITPDGQTRLSRGKWSAVL
ncbi:methyltransferase domain-containing protein [Streptomyces coacervatus]|uniref:Protein-L-isoaspartate O-methyltransferase n=1 Tax=Streptomyces coacervatus TaxID=647381 RepID=A0ABP7JAU1_9ACTN|nr:methyltransferase domain-containing protein [Streptomyces coacervatus]MDF2270280.1 methyltransferase domain-containing protein [Streptomyces coacervatus]